MAPSMSASAGGQVIESELQTSYNHQKSSESSSYIAGPLSPEPDEIADLICVGFGPASLAIGIALQDLNLSSRQKVTFLERQPKFAWHAGMQIPGAKMQISFLKDLATPRNPRSRFTFINYLWSKGRLNTFINLDTFTPSRREYEDYLRWCASHFEAQGLVSYSENVIDVVPVKSPSGLVTSFFVNSRNLLTGRIVARKARHVVIAVGGKPNLPSEFPQNNSQVVHSSQYGKQVGKALPDKQKAYNIAVVGNGQSAAEIFNNLPSRYPNAKVTMIIKQSALRPSDDSPFVNEVFDPERVDTTFKQEANQRRAAILLDRATNYGVVRIGLLQHLYETLYMQRLTSENPRDWPINILNNRCTTSVTPLADGSLKLQLRKVQDDGTDSNELEEMRVDAVFVATGYVRDAHENMLCRTRDLLAPQFRNDKVKFPVKRDYSVDFEAGKVRSDAGIWLQGCNEMTHGLSDTLLSVLSIRGGEIVNSIFGNNSAARSIRARL